MRDIGLGILAMAVGIPWALAAWHAASPAADWDFPIWLALPTVLTHYGAFRVIDGLVAVLQKQRNRGI